MMLACLLRTTKARRTSEVVVRSSGALLSCDSPGRTPKIGSNTKSNPGRTTPLNPKSVLILMAWLLEQLHSKLIAAFFVRSTPRGFVAPSFPRRIREKDAGGLEHH